MNGQTLAKGFVPLAGGATAVYNSGGLAYYRHSDWLGSSRLGSTPSRTVYYDGAYAPYGENYAETGTTDRSFTGQNQDTISSGPYPLYDFLYREHHPVWGRWLSPDPAGLAAVNPANPQSWNGYAYVLNNPTTLVDPQGLQDHEPHFNDAVSKVALGCGPAFGPCYYAEGMQISAAEAANLVNAGWAAVLPPGISPSGLVNGYYYQITFTGESEYPQISYPGLSDAQAESLVAQGKIPGNVPITLLSPPGAPQEDTLSPNARAVLSQVARTTSTLTTAEFWAGWTLLAAVPGVVYSFPAIYAAASSTWLGVEAAYPGATASVVDTLRVLSPAPSVPTTWAGWATEAYNAYQWLKNQNGG